MKIKIRDINSFGRTRDITAEEVKQFDRFKDYTDEHVHELIETIKTYTSFIYNLCSKPKKSGKVIALPIENKKHKAA